MRTVEAGSLGSDRNQKSSVAAAENWKVVLRGSARRSLRQGRHGPSETRLDFSTLPAGGCGHETKSPAEGGDRDAKCEILGRVLKEKGHVPFFPFSPLAGMTHLEPPRQKQLPRKEGTTR